MTTTPDLNDTIQNRLEVFVTSFVGYVEKQIESCFSDASIGANPQPAKKVAVAAGATQVGAGGVALAVFPPVASAASVASSKATEKIYGFLSGDQRKKASRLVKNYFRFIPKETRIQVFVDAAGVIFMSYEQPFMSVTGALLGDSWMTGIEKLSADAADRFMNYVIGSKDNTFSIEIVVKSVQNGESNNSGLLSQVFPKWAKTHKIKSSIKGHTIEVNGKSVKSSEVFETSTLVDVQDNGIVTKIYGTGNFHRRPFAWESAQGLEGVTPLDNTYKYQMTEEILHSLQTKILDLISRHDQELRDLFAHDNIEKLCETNNDTRDIVNMNLNVSEKIEKRTDELVEAIQSGNDNVFDAVNGIEKVTSNIVLPVMTEISENVKVTCCQATEAVRLAELTAQDISHVNKTTLQTQHILLRSRKQESEYESKTNFARFWVDKYMDWGDTCDTAVVDGREVERLLALRCQVERNRGNLQMACSCKTMDNTHNFTVEVFPLEERHFNLYVNSIIIIKNGNISMTNMTQKNKNFIEYPIQMDESVCSWCLIVGVNMVKEETVRDMDHVVVLINGTDTSEGVTRQLQKFCFFVEQTDESSQSNKAIERLHLVKCQSEVKSSCYTGSEKSIAANNNMRSNKPSTSGMSHSTWTVGNESLKSVLSSESANITRNGFCNDNPIFQSKLPEPKTAHIPRRISNQLVMDPRIFRADCNDVFVFKGMDTFQLASHTKPYVIRSSISQKRGITCRHISLENDEDWEDLSLLCSFPIHLVSFEQNSFVLVKSSKVSNIIQSFGIRKYASYLSEEEIVDYLISTQDTCGTHLLCDMPGTGKSWLMESLAYKLKSKLENSLVFYSHLSSFSSRLCKVLNQADNLDTLLMFFQVTCSSTQVASSMYKEFIRNGHHLHIFLDGYDEIADNNIEKTQAYILQLSKNTKIRLIISSRPNFRGTLERIFNVLSYNIQPFGKEEQVRAIVDIWQSKFSLMEPEGAKKLASKCLDSVEGPETENVKEIFGVPLQCFNLAGLTEKYAKQLMLQNQNAQVDISKINTILPVSLLYEKLLDTCIAKISQHSLDTTDWKQNILNFHKRKALEMLFPQLALELEKTLPTLAPDCARVGIMYLSEIGDYQFFGKTFAEYFTALFFAEFWTGVGAFEAHIAEFVALFYFNAVVCSETHRECAYIQFVGLDMYTALTHKMLTFENWRVLWFMDKIMERKNNSVQTNLSLSKLKSMLKPRTTETLGWFNIPRKRDSISFFKARVASKIADAIYACIDCGFYSLLLLFVSIVRTFFQLRERPSLLDVPMLFGSSSAGSTSFRYEIYRLFCRIALRGSAESAVAIWTLFDMKDPITRFEVVSSRHDLYTPLEIAVMRNNLDLTLFFVDKVEDVDWKRLLLRCLWGCAMNEDDIKIRVAIFENVMPLQTMTANGIDSECISNFLTTYASMDWPEQPLGMTTALQGILNLKELSTVEKKFLLRDALRRSSDLQLIEFLVQTFGNNESIPEMVNFKAEQILMCLDRMAVHESLKSIYCSKYATQVSELQGVYMTETLKVLIGICPDFKTISDHNWTYLHLAVSLVRVNWVEHLLATGFKINERDRKKNTPLHYIRLEQTLEITRLFDEHGAIMDAVNKYGENVAHKLLSICDTGDIDVISEWARYTMHKYRYSIWEKRAKNGKTPLQILENRLGSEDPLTILITSMLQDYSSGDDTSDNENPQ